MIGLLISILILFGVAAFLATSEMAFINIHPVSLREQVNKGEKGAKAILELRADGQHFFGTILIATNLTQVALITLMSYFLETHLYIQAEWIMTLITAPLVLIFCEMLPKEYARLNAFGFLFSRANILLILYKTFYFPAHAFMRCVELLFPKFNLKDEKIFTNEIEFKSLVAESEKKGVLDRHERVFVNMILDFERIAVRSVMTPLDQVAAVDLRADVSEARACARQKEDRVVLVYEDDPSIVAGVVHVFDILMKQREKGPLTEFLKAPLFISEKTSLEEAFQVLRQKRQSYALVTDDRFEVLGVVPIENLLLGKQA